MKKRTTSRTADEERARLLKAWRELDVRRMRRRGCRKLMRSIGAVGARTARLEALVLVLRATIVEEARDFFRGTRSIGRREAMRQELREAMAEGLGALAWAAQSSARRRILRELRALTRQDPDGEALRCGLAISREGRRFRAGDYKGVGTKELERLLGLRSRRQAVSEIETYLSKLSADARIGHVWPYAKQIVDLLGSERVVGFLRGLSRYTDIEAAALLAPLVPAGLRRGVLERAVDAQLAHGDQNTLVNLLGCVDLFSLQDAARLFCGTFGQFAWRGIPTLLRRYSDLYWLAPLIRRIGGNEALLAAAQEILALQPLLAPEPLRPRPAGRKVARRASGRSR